MDFDSGLSIITGETGAGKSIIIGALSLILGQRADTDVLFDKSKKCIIEGIFNITDFGWNSFFENNSLDYDNHVILRREINQHGKSRAFINDSPVTLNLLKEIGDKLVDIHSQHKTLTLNDSDFQLSVVDSYIQHHDLIDSYRKGFTQYKKLSAELKEQIELENKSKADLDYFQFQFDELESLNLVDDEQEKIEAELKMLTHAEEIKSALGKATYTLSTGNTTVISVIANLQLQLASLASYSENLKEISERLNGSYIELKDIAGEIEQAEQGVLVDPNRVEFLTLRLNDIYRLQQKHRVTSIQELQSFKQELSDKLFSISSLEDNINTLKKAIATHEEELKKQAEQLTKNRQKAIPSIEKELITLLKQLGMPDNRVKINCTQQNDFAKSGVDTIQFLFNANKGADLKELSKVASGGELSRLMLSIKSLISQKNLLPTIILDEIDMGVSGEVALKVGTIMKKMSATMQVIAITHLPQIARSGNHHYFVYKDSEGTSTKSHIRQLSEDERITEIAKMMSGDSYTEAAIETAKELLNSQK